jgi:hypothetical protein
LIYGSTTIVIIKQKLSKEYEKNWMLIKLVAISAYLTLKATREIKVFQIIKF